MRLRLIQQSEMPPGNSLRYLVPESGVWIPNATAHGTNSFTSFAELKEHVLAHYSGNKILPPKDLDALMQDQICRGGLPDGWCVEEGAHGKQRGTTFVGRIMNHFGFTLNSVIQGSAILTDYLINGGQPVSDAEAARRAAICLKCPMHGVPDGCTGCSSKPLRELVNSVVGGKPPLMGAQLIGCKACGCVLEAAVRVPIEFYKRNLSRETIEGHHEGCWKREALS